MFMSTTLSCGKGLLAVESVAVNKIDGALRCRAIFLCRVENIKPSLTDDNLQVAHCHRLLCYNDLTMSLNDAFKNL